MTELPGHITLKVTPDPYVTIRYAGASGDFNPIHIDEDFARSVGLPGRILHGLWSMAQVARAVTETTGDPASLKSLSAQFRGMGAIGQEITITGKVGPAVEDAAADATAAAALRTIKLDAVQGEQRLVKGAVAKVRS